MGTHDDGVFAAGKGGGFLCAERASAEDPRCCGLASRRCPTWSDLPARLVEEKALDWLWKGLARASSREAIAVLLIVFGRSNVTVSSNSEHHDMPPTN